MCSGHVFGDRAAVESGTVFSIQEMYRGMLDLRPHNRSVPLCIRVSVDFGSFRVIVLRVRVKFRFKKDSHLVPYLENCRYRVSPFLGACFSNITDENECKNYSVVTPFGTEFGHWPVPRPSRAQSLIHPNTNFRISNHNSSP